MAILTEILNRSTVKSFKNLPIEDNILQNVLEAGRLAPSAKNRQPWRFLVLTEIPVREKIMEACYGDKRIIQAPAVIVSCTTNIDYRMPNGQLSYPIDISIANAFMMLQAENSGLGSCVLTTYNEESVKDILTVPYSMRAVMILCIGYAEDLNYSGNRLPESRIFSYNHW